MKFSPRLGLTAPRPSGVGSSVGSSLLARSLRAPLVCAMLWAAGCAGGGGSSGGGTGSSGAHNNGDLVLNPALGTYFVAEAKDSGGVSQFLIEETYWGRLVDVYDWSNPTDPDSVSTTPVIVDFVIGDDIVGETDSFLLRRDPLTEREHLQIKSSRDSQTFRSVLAAAEANLQVALRKSLDPAELPPFTAVPRNSAMVLRFNSMLEDGGSPTPGNLAYPGTVNHETVRLLTGYAPTLPFEARIFPDPAHGNVVGGAFHSSRVVIDFSVSEDDAINSGLPVNALGLPESVTVNVPNAVVRVPTRVSGANQQFQVLRSLTGRALSFSSNGPVDASSATLDVVRAFRTGGKQSITGDANNGFLIDNDPPFLLGVQAVTIMAAVNPSLDLKEFDLTFRFAAVPCAVSPRKGDLINISGGARVAVLADYTSGISGQGDVGPMRVRAICQDCASLPSPGNVAEFFTTFTGIGQFQLPEYGACFVKFSPASAAPPNASIPTNATLAVRFSEPMDPSTIQAFDTFTIAYDNNKPSTNPLYANVVGRVIPSPDLRQFTFQPLLPLRKQLPGGNADQFLVELVGGLGGASDLAGNPLTIGLPATPFKVSTGAAAVDSAGVALKFNSGDEDGDGNPEIRGQILFDIARRLIKPRSVSRFSAVADTSVPVVGAMIPFTGPVQTPLSAYGSKMMSLWRYHDVGFSLRDQSTQNVDVEGLWWTPFSGITSIDNFSQFQMALAHSKYLPDEELSSGLLPNWTLSGLVDNFEGNLLDKVGDPLTVVHAKARGYTVTPTDVTQSATGNSIAPWPMNRGISPSQFTYWTWRDTGKIQVAGPNGDGADTQRLQQITKTAQTKFYPVSKVPTIGLPLLMEFRVYQDTQAVAQNGFKVALAINSSARPYFRVFSTGGVNVNNPAQIKIVNPDTELNATGAYPQNGNPAPGHDNVVYYGQADFLIRVSRMHTIWFDTLASGTLFSEPIIDPAPSLLPAGTQVALVYRGASSFTLNNPPAGVIPYNDSGNYDDYGDGFSSAQLTILGQPTGLAFTPSFFNVPVNTNDRSWKTNITAINGARYFQARVTFIANPNTSLIPELSALGFAFKR